MQVVHNSLKGFKGLELLSLLKSQFQGNTVRESIF
jgi:hypothetical protein